MRSHNFVWLALLLSVPGVPASAQVMPLGRMPIRGGVRPASCQTCEQPCNDCYAGTVWGTDCLDCNVKPGLFPPCPNPCQTTLLGELVYDVRTAVDCTLQHVLGCVFCNPCLCADVSTCCDPGCGSCAGDYGDAMEMMTPELAAPMGEPVPSQRDQDIDPFGDEPAPNRPLQPIPKSATTRSVIASPRVASKRHHARPQATARRASYEVPVGATAQDELHGRAVPAVAVQPSGYGVARGSQAYSLRRSTSLRRSNGEQLELTPIPRSGSLPPLRFRSSQ
jgi:hypothetical protein